MKKLIYCIALIFSVGLLQAQNVLDHNTTKDPKPASEQKVNSGQQATQEQKAVTPAPNPNAPEITFEKDVHDFGTITQGGDGTYEFKFTNTGKEPLIITNAKGSCGCTVPTWSKEPIKKGEQGTIKVSYDTKRIGQFTKTVTITSNAKTATKVLTIKGTVNAVESGTPFKKIEEGGTPIEKSK